MQQTAQDAAAQGAALHAQGAELQGQSEELQGIAAKLKENELATSIAMVTSPVAGPRVCHLTFVVVALGVIAWGIYNIAVSAKTTWMTPVTSVTTDYVLELPYPDFYLCVPARYVALATVTGMEINGGLGDEKSVRTVCGNAHSMVKMDPSTYKFDGDTVTGEHDAEKACVYKIPRAAEKPFEEGADVDVKFGCRAKVDEDCKTNQLDIEKSKESPVNELVATLPTYTDAETGKKYKAMCAEYRAKKGSKQLYSEDYEYMVFASIDTPKLKANGPFYQGFLTEQGVPPVNDGQVTAAQIKFPGGGMIGAAQVQVEKIKDETSGDKDFKSRYRYNMWTKPLTKCQDDAELADGTCPKVVTKYGDAIIGFYFDSFLVTSVTIRWKTFTEVYAELGGIYAASIAILLFVFTKSGHLNEKGGKEMYIFAYLPSSMRAKWLTAGVPKDEPPEKSAV